MAVVKVNVFTAFTTTHLPGSYCGGIATSSQRHFALLKRNEELTPGSSLDGLTHEHGAQPRYKQKHTSTHRIQLYF